MPARSDTMNHNAIIQREQNGNNGTAYSIDDDIVISGFSGKLLLLLLLYATF